MKDKKKILIAEDDVFLRKVYKITFEDKGFDVLLAASGSEALKFMKSDKPDILLLDLIMPDKSGFDVLEELNKTGQINECIVLVLSNLWQDHDVEKVKKLGAKDYIVKSSVNINEIFNKIQAYLK